jgi:hypothetical protein
VPLQKSLPSQVLTLRIQPLAPTCFLPPSCFALACPVSNLALG